MFNNNNGFDDSASSSGGRRVGQLNENQDEEMPTENEHFAEMFVDHDGSEVRFPEDENEEIQFQKSGDLPKIILKWKSAENFIPIKESEMLVERELNLTSSIKTGNELQDCLNMFTAREQLDENDSWYCPKCKEHRRAFKKLDLWKFPKILIVHLKRFNYSRFSREKTDTEITIPVK